MCRFALCILATAVIGAGQVQVSLRTDRAAYLAGEPVFVVVDVKNVGTESVGYGSGVGHTELTVPDAAKKRPISFSCFIGWASGGFGGGIDHPPMMKPGQTIVYWYLLKGYNLPPGNYTLHVSGRADVTWKYYPVPGGPPPKHTERDPVEGAVFTTDLKLTVEAGTDARLRQRYEPYVADARGWDRDLRRRARQAISEMAPPFLEKTLLGFADEPETADLAVDGLGQIATPESRGDLIALFDKSADLRLRARIAEKLAGIGTLDELAFFASLLPGRSTRLDSEIRKWAVLGLGRIGGPDAVKALETAEQDPELSVRETVAIGLGDTKDGGAVPVLIRMYADPNEQVHNQVCPALMTLTHYQWCADDGQVSEIQVSWRSWWQKNAAQVPLYNADQCPALGTQLPAIR